MPGDINIKSGPSARRKIVHFGPALESLHGLTLEEFLEKYNALGFDNGDGEFACSRVDIQAGKPAAIPLSFSDHSAKLYHVPNIIAFSGQKAKLVDAALLGDERGEIYHNFKRCPGGHRTQNQYLNHRGKPSPYTYGDLMGHSFACAVSKLFECNKCLDREKPTVIMVGRPASKGWEDQEQAYADLLGRYLKNYLPNAAPITILVLSESCAAMAGEIKLEQNKWLNTVIQILDLGSSTFDITTVTPKGLPANGEDSFQFGGNQLDKAIAGHVDYLYYKKYPKDQGYVMEIDPGKKAKLRFKKELCYGDNGSNLKENTIKPEPYSCFVCRKGTDGEPEKVIDEDTEEETLFSFRVSATAMGSILRNEKDQHGLQCKTERLKYNALHEIKKHKSWLEACRYVMTQFYEQTKALYPNGKAPGRLILTGGVSNMPEVQEIAKEVFHVNEGACEFKVSDSPSLTVSTGLALVLGNELLKKNLLRELEQELLGENSPLPDAKSLLKEMVDAACKSDLDYYGAVIGDWRLGDGDKTLRSCIDKICDKKNGIFHKYDNFVEKACENWFRNKKIDEIIGKALQKKFHQMFPEFPKAFHWQIKMPDMSDMPGKELENTFKINPYMFFDDNNCPADPYDTNQSFTRSQRGQILEVYNRHKWDLAKGGQYPVKGHSVNIKGIKSVYEEQLTVADAQPYREEILKKLMPAIEDFVESLTYYLAMSAHI